MNIFETNHSVIICPSNTNFGYFYHQGEYLMVKKVNGTWTFFDSECDQLVKKDIVLIKHSDGKTASYFKDGEYRTAYLCNSIDNTSQEWITEDEMRVSKKLKHIKEMNIFEPQTCIKPKSRERCSIQ